MASDNTDMDYHLWILLKSVQLGLWEECHNLHKKTAWSLQCVVEKFFPYLRSEMEV